MVVMVVAVAEGAALAGVGLLEADLVAVAVRISLVLGWEFGNETVAEGGVFPTSFEARAAAPLAVPKVSRV